MRRQYSISWVFVGALFVLCGVLGILQYRWIGEVSVAARERLRNSLQANLEQLSQDFNAEITAACRPLMPAGAPDAEAVQRDIESRYDQWKSRSQARQIVQRVALAIPRDGALNLRSLNWETGRFEDAAWPEGWSGLEQRMETRLAGRGGGLPPVAPGEPDLLIEAPVFGGGPGGPGFPPAPFQNPFGGRREIAWVIFQLNLPQIRSAILPEIVERHLVTGGALDYEVEVAPRGEPESPIYVSDPDAGRAWKNADASVGLLDVRLMDGGGRGGRGGRGRGMGSGLGGPDSGRWQMFVRHRAGSLEKVVAQARWRNLGVTGGVLLLLVVTLGALLRFTRNAQRLAELQMDFVAGVSHELRTPLTALYTAGHNLRGRVAHQPAQVERYGEMIQQETGRLKDLVEQVLRFASAGAGRVIQEPTRAAVGQIIEDSLEASRAMLQSTQCTVDTEIAPDLPEVMADQLALKHALQNLLTNAVKYGARESCWVGVKASRVGEGVEIRVADRGAGIPEDEQKRIFDAFYRGKRANQEQSHGAGLGLNLVKKIVEAHGGTIRVESKPDEGAQFIVRLPAAPASAVS
jgi:signal transduction histidine kinase